MLDQESAIVGLGSLIMPVETRQCRVSTFEKWYYLTFSGLRHGSERDAHTTESVTKRDRVM